MDQLRHCVQSIEEKVRLELHPEQLEVRLRQARLELGGVDLTRLEERKVSRRLCSYTENGVRKEAALYRVSQHAGPEHVSVDDTSHHCLQDK
jgi:hypothetical protein